MAFLIGALLFGSIGVVVATATASSAVSYLKNNVDTVEEALDVLYTKANVAASNIPITCYNGTCGSLSYRYWNNNFAGSTGANLFDSTHMPANNYATRALLEQNYGSSNFASRPYYIRSVLINGNVVGHQACLWSTTTNKEFCFPNDYWVGTIGTQDATAGTQTKIKLQRDMQNALGVTIDDSSCSSSVNGAGCSYGTYRCNTRYNGNDDCNGGDAACYVNGDGSALCHA